MGCVQGHRHVHLTVMPPLPQIISSINVIIWLDRVQSWIFNSAIEGVQPPPSSPSSPPRVGEGKVCSIICFHRLELSLRCSRSHLYQHVRVKVKQVTRSRQQGAT